MNLREHVITFGGPGVQEIQVQGRFIRVTETPVSEVFISVEAAGEVKLGAGMQIPKPTGSHRVRVRSGVAQTVRLIVSDEKTDDDRTNAAVTVSATIAGSTAVQSPAVVSVPAGSTAQLAGANADRVELRVSLGSAQSSHVWLGPSGVGDQEGGLLEQGVVDYLATTAAVFAHNPGASAVDVSVLELESP